MDVKTTNGVGNQEFVFQKCFKLSDLNPFKLRLISGNEAPVSRQVSQLLEAKLNRHLLEMMCNQMI